MSDVSEYFDSSIGMAKSANVASLDDDPEQAARSLELSEATGVPATAIYGDLEGFERQNKAAMAAGIIGDNLHIADYLNSHPMAPRLSHDDLGQLDTASQSIQRLHQKSFLERIHDALGVGKLADIAFPGDPLAPFKEFYGTRPTDVEFALRQPAAYSVMKGAENLLGTPFVVGGQIISGLTNIVKEFGGRDLAAMLEYEITKPEGGQLGQYLETTRLPELGSALHVTAPYAKAGKEPPVGVHPLIDEVKVAQAKEDADVLKDALSESAKSATRDRSPDMYARFVLAHVGDREIGIDAEAIRKLYGDKVPEVDDNLLGWIPDLQSKLAAAEGVGGDIRVPLSDYLARVDPDVAKELHDNIRVRDGGITVEEAKELESKESIPEPVSLIRGEAGLEPMFSVGDRKLSLQRIPEAGKEVPAWYGDVRFHDFDMLDETGKTVGSLNLSEQRGGKQLYVEMIQGGGNAKMYDPNFFGPSLMRDLLRQIKQEFPNAETITGHRVSGARERAGTYEQKLAMPVIKLDKDFDANTAQQFKDLVSPYWKQIERTGGIEALYKPTELWSAKEKELGAAIEDELHRLVPGVDPQIVHAIHRPDVGTGRTVYGMYHPTGLAGLLPQIFVSLEKKTALDVARHEAIHHLYRMGLFSEAEWNGLKAAAESEGWIKKFNIEKRYPEGGRDYQLEEAIAEGFQSWKLGETILKDDGVFQKIKDFVDQMYQAVKKVLGRDFTWEELFQQVDRGEVGRREPKSSGIGEPGFDLEEFKDNVTRMRKAANDNLTALEQRRAEGQIEEPGYDASVDRMWNDIRAKSDKANSLMDQIDDITGRAVKDKRQLSEIERAKIQKLLDEWNNLTDIGPRYSQDIGDEGLFEKAKAMGITQAHMNRMLKLIQKRNEEDLAAATSRAERQQKRSQTKEWKERRTDIRDEVREQLSSRPDFAVDEFFSRGEAKLHPDFLTEEQKASLPKEYIQKKNGVNPDDLAPYFGYTSGDALIERLGMLTSDRRSAGLSQRDYFNRIVDVEADRRLNAEFGDLNKRIMEEAKDQALSETQLNLVHEETLAYALAAKQEPKFTKEQTRDMVKQAFDSVLVGQISSDRLIQTAGKLGRKIEEAASKGDWAEAYRLSQQRNHATIAAKLARGYERAKASLDRTAKTFRKREVPSVAQEYTNWVHDLLMRVGYPVNRSVQDLAQNISRQSHSTLQEFVDAKRTEWMGLRDLPIADTFTDPNFRTALKDLPHSDFREFKNAIDMLVKAGRDEKKIYREGEAADREQVLQEMIGKLETFPLKEYPATKGTMRKVLEVPKAFMAGMTNIETLLNRWDRADPRGIFNRYLAYPLAKASNTKNVLEREAARNLKEVGPLKNRNKLVDSPFSDPLLRTSQNPDGAPFAQFTRANVMAMVHNAGNKSNWTVLARGYGMDPDALMKWLHRNSTQDMWDRAQKMGDLFKGLAEKADNVYERITGADIEKIKIEPFETPFGRYEGWYHPLIRDPLRQEIWEQDQAGQWVRKPAGRKVSVYDDLDNFHISTANSYTKRRTGTIYPLDLNADVIPSRMKQIIHDVAFRETILEADKIFSNKAFQAEVIKHYGDHYEDLLRPYLKHLAGAESISSRAGSKAAQVSEFMRQNVISTYIGFNPFTALKHGPTAWVMSMGEVGGKNFLNAVKSLYGKSPELGLSNSEFAMKWSEELQRRERHWQDTIGGEHASLEGSQNLRERIIEKGSWLVAQSDMLSAKPTWVAAYNKYLADGLSHGESIDLADRAVRRAHGSTAATNQPSLVRGGGPLHGWLTSVYGFFGTAMQRRIEIAHQLNDVYHSVGEGEISAAARKVPSIAADVFTYVIWPTIVEEWVTGLTTDDRRGWGTHLAAGAFMGLSSSVLYLRDLMHAFVTGQDPGVGLLSSPLHDMNNMLRDFKKGKEAMNKAHAGKTVADTMTVFGELTGMAPKTIANATRFGIDLVNKQTHPKGPAEVFRGVTRGTTKLRVEK